MSDRFNWILQEAVEKYAKDIASEEVECHASEEEWQKLLSKKEVIYNNILNTVNPKTKARNHKNIKRLIVIAAILSLLAAMALNVTAFRVFFIKTYTNLQGTILNISTEAVDKKTYETITNFSQPDDIIIPDWLPPGMAITEFVDKNNELFLFYENKESAAWVSLNEITIPVLGLHNSIQTEKNPYKISDYTVMGMEGIMVEVTSENGETIYTVVWNSEHVRYELSTNASRPVLEAILNNLTFYSE